MNLSFTPTALAGAVGLAAALLAVVSRWADMRRLQREDPDAVGFMPWTGIYFSALMVSCIMLGFAVRSWMHG